MDLDKVEMPKVSIGSPKEWPSKIKKTLKEWRRVYKITKKPNREEFTAIVKVTGLGILLVGVVGFAIFIFVELIK
jgi:protein transport protein SEC61 subunit gamma and related proteins